MSNFTHSYINETIDILSNLNQENEIEYIADILNKVRLANGRLFILGVGGSAGTASHAVNDFRKLCQINTFCPTDNVSELTARINDEGWDNSFELWLKCHSMSSSDAVLILSVGGGNLEKNVSVNLIKAIDYSLSKDTKVLGIVGRDGGYTKQKAHGCVIIPNLYPTKVTPHTEGICSVLLHLLVTHPKLKENETKW